MPVTYPASSNARNPTAAHISAGAARSTSVEAETSGLSLGPKTSDRRGEGVGVEVDVDRAGAGAGGVKERSEREADGLGSAGDDDGSTAQS